MGKRARLSLDARKIGRRIRDRRTELQLSQRAVAGPGVTAAYLSRVEKGERTPSLTALIYIAERLDTTAMFLATGDGAAPCPFCGRV